MLPVVINDFTWCRHAPWPAWRRTESICIGTLANSIPNMIFKQQVVMTCTPCTYTTHVYKLLRRHIVQLQYFVCLMAYSTAVSLSAMLQLLPLMLLCSIWFSINSSTAVNIFIDANEGQNTSECVPAGSKAFPCQTLQYAVTYSYNDTTFTFLSDALIDMVVHFISRSNITITIESDKQNKQILCDCKDNSSCGLLFENCENVTLERVTVKNCSVRMATKDEVLVIRAGFIIVNGAGSTRLNHFSATENQGFGMVIFNTVGTVDVFSSNFTNNSLHFQGSFGVQGGGGLYIVVDCRYKEITRCFYSDCQYNIIDSKFYGTHQKWNESYRMASASYGGGLGLFICAKVKKNHFFHSKVYIWVKCSSLWRRFVCWLWPWVR